MPASVTAPLIRNELQVLSALVPLEGQRIIELGCGNARLARQLLQAYPASQVTGLEVDARQHAKNLADPQEHLSFVAAGAQEVGFPIGSIVAGAGLIGLTISLAAQESASNLFSGIVILLDKPFAVGDWITVGDVEGEVIDINFRSTRIRSPDKTVNVITNSKICSATVQNAALRTMRPYKFTLGVTYSTTRPQLEKLMQDLQAMLDASPLTNHGTNIVQLASFGDSSINILISAYLLTNVYAEFLQMQNDLNLNIMDIMQADGVDFAFPSTSVYIEKN